MPIGGKEAYEHFKKTILNKVSLEDIKNLLTKEDYEKLNNLFPLGEANVWGLKPGKNNEKVWKKLNETIRTIVIFVVKKHPYIILTEVRYTLRNEKLAKYLWGTSKDGKTWELIFFLEILKCFKIDSKTFLTKILGYSERDMLMGNRRISEKINERYKSLENFIKKLSEYKEVLPKHINKNLEKAEIAKILRKTKKNELKKLKEILENPQAPERIEFKGKRFKRSYLVREYVKRIAGYRCEICGFSFKKKDGSNYVESAHIRPLKDGGPDTIYNVVALCPNHHKMLDEGSLEERKKVLQDLLRIKRAMEDKKLKQIIEEELEKINKQKNNILS